MTCRFAGRIVALALTWCALAAGSPAAEETPPRRGLKICAAADAPPVVRQAARAILDAVPTHPLLALMAEGSPPAELTDSGALGRGPAVARALDHLVLVGLPDDPLVAAAWQREARRQGDDWYIFGFGHFRGTLGYVESDRNPFLHGAAIARTPFETQVVTISGSSAGGVAIAAEAFLRLGLVNGVVAAGTERPRRALLERDPLPPGIRLPDFPPARVGAWRRIGVTQAAEDEYRGVLETAGVAPRTIWRWKFHTAGAWDGGGQAKAFEHYAAGLHRRAHGNTVWTGQFRSAVEAEQAASRIAAAARLAPRGEAWVGQQPPHGYHSEAAGPLELWRRGPWLIQSTLPADATERLRALEVPD